MTRLPRKKAFTLIELLIVITIIGILAAALLPRITAGPAKARDAQRKADLQQIATALNFYADDKAGKFPPTEATGCLPDLSNYMTTTPNDPQGADSNACVGGYTYQSVDSGNGFVLGAKLENNSSVGAGFYNLTAAQFTADETDDFQTILGTLTACDGTIDCMYVVGQ